MTAVASTTGHAISRKIDLPDYEGAKRFAQNLLIRNNVTAPPVNVYAIARSAEISVQQADFKLKHQDITGIIECHGNAIIVNRAKPVSQQNFAVAHGLGHIVLGHTICEEGQNYHHFYYDQIKTEMDRSEQEANYFATCILVPDASFRKFLWNYPTVSDQQLADIFNVPIGVIGLKRFSM
jgi:Zn-dependent peptidase ImmA (M78 family)